MSNDPYDPRLDPEFVNAVLDVVVSCHPHFVHAGRVVLQRRGGECDCHDLADCTAQAINKGRRVGLLVEGDRVHGYCLRGFKYVRYLQPHKVLAWPPADATNPLSGDAGEARSDRLPPHEVM